MKALLLGFIVIIFAASLVPTRAPASPTHYSPYKKQWYKEFQESVREISCVFCNTTWECSNWAITPGELSPFSLISNNQIRFCSIDCRNQWQSTRKVK